VRLASILAGLLVGIICATPGAAATNSPLQDAVANATAQHSGTVAVVVHNLATDEAVSVNADRRFVSASLYKLFVLEAAESGIEDGSLDPREVLTLDGATTAADPYADLQAGTRISVDCALQTMVEMSGNSAADLLLRRLGSTGVNARIAADGFTHTSVGDVSAYTSASDVGHLFDELAAGTAVNAAASQRMLEMLSAQQHNDRIPAPLPAGIRVAHKTGELPGLRHDAGIVFAPSGPYVLVALVDDAPTESDARNTIVDVSRAVYAALQPDSESSEIAPRVAEQVWRLPDAQGRLALLGDPRTETAALPTSIQATLDSDSVRLRPELVKDLSALQVAAEAGGAPFWVRSGFVQPTDAEAAFALPTEWYVPCGIEQPQRVADRPFGPGATGPKQAWLGTTLTVSDRADGGPSTDDANSATWGWLVQHAMDYGFVPALPEAAATDGHEPWTLRWVGRELAQRVAPLDGSDYAQRLTGELARADARLVPHARVPAALGDACWTIATTSTQGCPSRWYFLGLSLS
jgi:beta-lactamase class A